MPFHLRMKLKLQVVLIPATLAEITTEKVSLYKKFLHLADPKSTIGEVCDALVGRYYKLYPDAKELRIEGVQDNDRCDLDPDFNAEDVFNSGDTLRILCENLIHDQIGSTTILEGTSDQWLNNTTIANNTTRKRTSLPELDGEDSRFSKRSRTIWGVRLSSALFMRAADNTQDRVTVTNDDLEVQKVPLPESPTLLPPPDGDETSAKLIPHKKLSPNSYKGKRITSGMLQAPNNLAAISGSTGAGNLASNTTTTKESFSDNDETELSRTATDFSRIAKQQGPMSSDSEIIESASDNESEAVTATNNLAKGLVGALRNQNLPPPLLQPSGPSKRGPLVTLTPASQKLKQFLHIQASSISKASSKDTEAQVKGGVSSPQTTRISLNISNNVVENFSIAKPVNTLPQMNPGSLDKGKYSNASMPLSMPHSQPPKSGIIGSLSASITPSILQNQPPNLRKVGSLNVTMAPSIPQSQPPNLGKMAYSNASMTSSLPLNQPPLGQVANVLKDSDANRNQVPSKANVANEGRSNTFYPPQSSNFAKQIMHSEFEIPDDKTSLKPAQNNSLNATNASQVPFNNNLNGRNYSQPLNPGQFASNYGIAKQQIPLPIGAPFNASRSFPLDSRSEGPGFFPQVPQSVNGPPSYGTGSSPYSNLQAYSSGSSGPMLTNRGHPVSQMTNTEYSLSLQGFAPMPTYQPSIQKSTVASQSNSLPQPSSFSNEPILKSSLQASKSLTNSLQARPSTSQNFTQRYTLDANAETVSVIQRKDKAQPNQQSVISKITTENSQPKSSSKAPILKASEPSGTKEIDAQLKSSEVVLTQSVDKSINLSSRPQITTPEPKSRTMTKKLATSSKTSSLFVDPVDMSPPNISHGLVSQKNTLQPNRSNLGNKDPQTGYVEQGQEIRVNQDQDHAGASTVKGGIPEKNSKILSGSTTSAIQAVSTSTSSPNFARTSEPKAKANLSKEEIMTLIKGSMRVSNKINQKLAIPAPATKLFLEEDAEVKNRIRIRNNLAETAQELDNRRRAATAAANSTSERNLRSRVNIGGIPNFNFDLNPDSAVEEAREREREAKAKGLPYPFCDFASKAKLSSVFIKLKKLDGKLEKHVDHDVLVKVKQEPVSPKNLKKSKDKVTTLQSKISKSPAPVSSTTISTPDTDRSFVDLEPEQSHEEEFEENASEDHSEESSEEHSEDIPLLKKRLNPVRTLPAPKKRSRPAYRKRLARQFEDASIITLSSSESEEIAPSPLGQNNTLKNGFEENVSKAPKEIQKIQQEQSEQSENRDKSEDLRTRNIPLAPVAPVEISTDSSRTNAANSTTHISLVNPNTAINAGTSLPSYITGLAPNKAEIDKTKTFTHEDPATHEKDRAKTNEKLVPIDKNRNADSLQLNHSNLKSTQDKGSNLSNTTKPTHSYQKRSVQTGKDAEVTNMPASQEVNKLESQKDTLLTSINPSQPLSSRSLSPLLDTSNLTPKVAICNPLRLASLGGLKSSINSESQDSIEFIVMDSQLGSLNQNDATGAEDSSEKLGSKSDPVSTDTNKVPALHAQAEKKMSASPKLKLASQKPFPEFDSRSTSKLEKDLKKYSGSETNTNSKSVTIDIDSSQSGSSLSPLPYSNLTEKSLTGDPTLNPLHKLDKCASELRSTKVNSPELKPLQSPDNDKLNLLLIPQVPNVTRRASLLVTDRVASEIMASIADNKSQQSEANFKTLLVASESASEEKRQLKNETKKTKKKEKARKNLEALQAKEQEEAKKQAKREEKVAKREKKRLLSDINKKELTERVASVKLSKESSHLNSNTKSPAKNELGMDKNNAVSENISPLAVKDQNTNAKEGVANKFNVSSAEVKPILPEVKLGTGSMSNVKKISQIPEIVSVSSEISFNTASDDVDSSSLKPAAEMKKSARRLLPKRLTSSTKVNKSIDPSELLKSRIKENLVEIPQAAKRSEDIQKVKNLSGSLQKPSKPSLLSLNSLAARGVPDVQDSISPVRKSSLHISKPSIRPIGSDSSSDESASESDSESGSESGSDSSSRSGSDSDDDNATSKFVNLNKLRRKPSKTKKRKSNGGFSSLMKDANKKK